MSAPPSDPRPDAAPSDPLPEVPAENLPDAPPASEGLDRPPARAAVSREARGYRLRLDPADLARLRELPGSRGRTDEQLGEEFLAGQADRFVSALTEDVATPEEIRVVVDPWSRQAFLAVGRTIRAIVSF